MTIDLITDTASNLAAVTRGEIDSQIATAKEYPRDIAESKATIRELALIDADTAAQMFYAVPRAGKTVEGPSVRLAEVVAYSWQNIRFESRIVGADDSFVTAQATVMDMERNTAGRGECKRRITNREGKKFGDDMIQTTCNAACAIALREAVFRVVPRVMFDAIWREAKAVSVGDIKSTIQAASKAMAWFAKSGVIEDRVLAAIGRNSIAAVTADDLATLRGITQALKEGTTTLEDAFPPIIDKPLGTEQPSDAMENSDAREHTTDEPTLADSESDTEEGKKPSTPASETDTDGSKEAAGGDEAIVQGIYAKLKLFGGLTTKTEVKGLVKSCMEASKAIKDETTADEVVTQITVAGDERLKDIDGSRGEKSNTQGR